MPDCQTVAVTIAEADSWHRLIAKDNQPGSHAHPHLQRDFTRLERSSDTGTVHGRSETAKQGHRRHEQCTSAMLESANGIRD